MTALETAAIYVRNATDKTSTCLLCHCFNCRPRFEFFGNIAAAVMVGLDVDLSLPQTPGTDEQHVGRCMEQLRHDKAIKRAHRASQACPLPSKGHVP